MAGQPACCAQSTEPRGNRVIVVSYHDPISYYDAAVRYGHRGHNKLLGAFLYVRSLVQY